MVALGLIFMIAFHVGVKEQPVSNKYFDLYGDEESTSSIIGSIQSVSSQKTITSWFKTPLFYQVMAKSKVYNFFTFSATLHAYIY